MALRLGHTATAQGVEEMTIPGLRKPTAGDLSDTELHERMQRLQLINHMHPSHDVRIPLAQVGFRSDWMNMMAREWDES